MPITHSPLRYPGGKSKIAPIIKDIISENDLIGCDYVEPFVGGGGLALDLLFTGFVKTIHLNDLDPSIYNLWYVMVNRSQDLCDRIRETQITIDEWNLQKNIFGSDVGVDPLGHALATLFLNRTNRSGILMGGVMGGKAQLGRYKLDSRFNKEDIIRKIMKIHEFRESIFVYNKNAKNFISSFPAKRKPFTYLDPPYYHKGKILYKKYFNHSDHKELADILRDTGGSCWAISYDNCDEIREIYHGLPYREYKLNYSAKKHITETEIMFLSPHLK